MFILILQFEDLRPLVPYLSARARRLHNFTADYFFKFQKLFQTERPVMPTNGKVNDWRRNCGRWSDVDSARRDIFTSFNLFIYFRVHKGRWPLVALNQSARIKHFSCAVCGVPALYRPTNHRRLLFPPTDWFLTDHVTQVTCS